MARAAKLDLRAFQQELATRLAAKTAAQVEQSRLGLACAGEQWLIRLADAGEVIAVPTMATVPLTKPWYLGVANIRGNLYGVVDFAGFLGHPLEPVAPGTSQTRLVLFGPRVGELHAGLIVPSRARLAQSRRARAQRRAPRVRRTGTARAGRKRTATCGRRSTWRGSRRIPPFCRWDCDRRSDDAKRSFMAGENMALRLKSMLGAKPARGKSGKGAELEMPTTTQVKMNAPPAGYDPLASVSIMEQLRSAASEARQPSRLWFIGHLPVAKQEQVLGGLTLLFLVLGGVMLYLYISLTEKERGQRRHRDRNADALAAPCARHVACGAGQRVGIRRRQGLPRSLPRRSRCADQGRRDHGRADRCHQRRPALQAQLNDINERWDAGRKGRDRGARQPAEPGVAGKGPEGINEANTTLLELAQQAASQAAAGGGSVREIDFTNQLAMLSQRIAKNANSLVSSDDIDPEVAFLLGKDAGTFRDILNGLLKGSDALRLPGVRNDEVRATLAELQKRFAAYEGGVNAILQNMQRLVVAKQAARGINQESEPLLDAMRPISPTASKRRVAVAC